MILALLPNLEVSDDSGRTLAFTFQLAGGMNDRLSRYCAISDAFIGGGLAGHFLLGAPGGAWTQDPPARPELCLISPRRLSARTPPAAILAPALAREAEGLFLAILTSLSIVGEADARPVFGFRGTQAIFDRLCEFGADTENDEPDDGDFEDCFRDLPRVIDGEDAIEAGVRNWTETGRVSCTLAARWQHGASSIAIDLAA